MGKLSNCYNCKHGMRTGLKDIFCRLFKVKVKTKLTCLYWADKEG